ncbi:MAG: type III pantothenate kinase, partial [Cyclobacteriaceae bacterium]|nr:type III pantothenate kinase [Cyclobacteriaceae bacterium]
MNICIDIGNTKAKIGFFSNNELLEVKQNITDRGIIKIIKAHNPEHVVISSVRKGIGKIVESCSKTADTIVFDHLTPVPVKSLYKTPQTLGVDRIAAVVGAALLYKHQNCLIIDMGTCITYDLIDKSATYHGGGISPGVDMRMKAMHKFTSRLPVIAAKGQPELIGKTTKECMLSGAIIGTQAELEGIINRYKQFFDDLAIIFCGGDANFFETKIKDHIFAIPNLVL